MSTLLESRSDFATLYAAVARQMARFCDERVRAEAVARDEADWFRQLLVDFEREFERWGGASAAPRVNDYLRRLDGEPRVVRLAGHVFLHIAFDLPRVLRASFVERPAIARHRMRGLFLMPAALLHLDAMRRTELARHDLRARLLGRIGGLRVLAQWVQALRTNAWLHAEIAHDAGVAEARFEDALMDGLDAGLSAARSAGRTRWFGRGDATTIDRFAAAIGPRVATRLMSPGHVACRSRRPNHIDRKEEYP